MADIFFDDEQSVPSNEGALPEIAPAPATPKTSDDDHSLSFFSPFEGPTTIMLLNRMRAGLGDEIKAAGAEFDHVRRQLSDGMRNTIRNAGSAFMRAEAAVGTFLGNFDMDKAIDYLREHSFDHYNKDTCGNCAHAIRMALLAGGMKNLAHTHPGHAAGYAGMLPELGFRQVTDAHYQKGDIRVFAATRNHPSGHIDMYDGHRFVSDFKENSAIPLQNYELGQEGISVYRLPSKPLASPSDRLMAASTPRAMHGHMPAAHA